MSGDVDVMSALIADVRHDTNNSLMAILGYLELVLGRDDLPEGVPARLGLIQAEAYKIRDCIARTASIRRPGT